MSDIVAPLGEHGSRERRENVRRYFRLAPDPHNETIARRLIGIALIGAVTAAATAITLTYVIAILLAGVALICGLQGWTQLREYRRLYALAEPKPHWRDMDLTLAQDLHRAAKQAKDRLEITDDELELHSGDVDRERLADQGFGPLTVFGPAKGCNARRGSDGKWRFTSYDVMVICPTGYHFAIFETKITFDSGAMKGENTHEYHYADVVAVLTQTVATSEYGLIDVEPDTHPVALDKTLAREFSIVVSSGDRSSIAVRIDRERLQESGVDRVIRAVRQTLREKKGGTLPPLTA